MSLTLLDDREKQVYELLVQGHLNTEISTILGLTKPMVNKAVVRIMQLTGLCRMELILDYIDKHDLPLQEYRKAMRICDPLLPRQQELLATYLRLWQQYQRRMRPAKPELWEVAIELGVSKKSLSQLTCGIYRAMELDPQSGRYAALRYYYLAQIGALLTQSDG